MKKKVSKNYLDKKPMRAEALVWKADDEGIVTFEIENKGAFNTIAQKLFKKPRISYVHLDKLGSFIWQLFDGERDLTALGELVEKEFGQEAHPLYERLVKYTQILESYGFITWNERSGE